MGNSESTSSTNSTEGGDLPGHLDSGIYTDFFATLTAATGVALNTQDSNQAPKDETSDRRSNNFYKADEAEGGRAPGIARNTSLSGLFPFVPSSHSASKSPKLSSANSSSTSATKSNRNTNSRNSVFDSRVGTTTIVGDAIEQNGDIVLVGNFDFEEEGSTDEELGESTSRPTHGHGTARSHQTEQQGRVPNTKMATNVGARKATQHTADTPTQQRRWSRHSRTSIRRAKKEYAIPEHLVYAFTTHAADRLRLTFAFYDRDGSGAITRDELAQVMAKFGHDTTDRKLDALMLEADSSGNGEIDFGEFCTLMASDTGRGAFAELNEQVDKVVHQRSAGDPCFAPRGRAGTCVLVVNSIGWFVSVFALIAVAWAPSSLNDEEEGGKDTSFGWAWTRESMSLQADLVKTLKWLKVSEVHTSGGAGLALTYGPPLVLLAVFTLPLLCCTRGPLDYHFVQRLHAFVALLLALVLAVSNDYPTLNGSSHGASSKDRSRRWLYWTFYAALAMLLGSYVALRFAANKFQEVMSSDIAAAQALKEKLARLEDQERAKDIKAHATKTSSPRKQWSSPMLLNQDTTKNNNRLRNEMPLLSLDGRSGVEEAKFDPTPESDVIVVQVAASAEDNEKTRADSSSSMESPVLEAVVESVVTTSSSSSNSSSQHAPQKGEPTQSERKAVRTTFAGGARTRLGDRLSKDGLNPSSKSREKVPGLSLDAPLPPPFTPLELSAGDGDRSRSILGGDSSGSRVRKKEVVPRKSSLKVASSSDGSNNNAMSSKSRDGLPLHARFNLPDSPRNGPVNASAAAASSSSPLQQQQRPSPSAMKNAPAPPPRNTRERLVSSQLDIHKWQKKRMEQGDDLGRIY